MSKEERLQQILKAFVDTLDQLAEGRRPLEAHAATIQRLLTEVRELKAAVSELEAAKSTVRLLA